jgi:hypothetical protein
VNSAVAGWRILFCLRSEGLLGWHVLTGWNGSREPDGMAAERERLMAIDEPALRTSEQSGALLRRGRILEGVTLGWNVAGIAVPAVAARSVAPAGFGLDSLIEIGASTVVLWELSGSGEERQRRALRLIGGAFVALAAYLTVQSVLVLATGYRPGHSVPGIAWTAVTAAVMFALAAGKARTGKALGNPVLVTEGRVTLVDGILATAVLTGLALNAAAGWWWAGSPGRPGHRGLRAAGGAGDLPVRFITMAGEISCLNIRCPVPSRQSPGPAAARPGRARRP